MATSGSTSTGSTGTSVSEGFYYETKYIVIRYLQLPPARLHALHSAQGDAQLERQKTDKIKEQIEEELKKLEDEIAVSSSSSGFDRHASIVFNPTNPDNSIEDCLAVLGDQVVIELDTHLATAVDTLLEGPLDYEIFRETIFDLSVHTHGDWNKVLVPLVLLQALQAKGQTVSSLLSLGVHFLKENDAEYIIQQGGWGKVFGLVSEEEQGVTIAEDSNDIYILSGEQHPDQLSPPSSLLCTEGNSSGHSSWQTESLPVSLAAHESWAQVAGMDPEDVKSLDSNEGVALAEERSENNSSNSDIVHVEREDAELLEEAGEGGAIEESLMSVLGTESDLAALREEYREQTPPLPLSSEAESATPASLMSLEEPVVIDTSLSAEPSLLSLEAELTEVAPGAAIPPEELQSVPALEPQPEPTPVPVEEEPIAVTNEPVIESTPAPEEVKSRSEMSEVELKPPVVPPPSDESLAQAEQETEVPILEATAPPVAAPVREIPEQLPVEPEPTSDFPVLLYGGAALALITGILAYGVISYRRK